MGLNLPIRRVVFSTIEKFDGVASRTINATETRQIAGRAGRYGIYPTGYVSAFENDELVHLEHMLTTSDVAELIKLPIAPNFLHIQAIAGTLHRHKISELLTYFAERIAFNSDLFETAPLQAHTALAVLIDAHAPNLALVDKFIFSCAPVSLDKPHERDYFLSCLSCVMHAQKKGLPRDADWLSSTSPKHLEAAEDLSKDISLYAWLSYKYPAIFYENEALPVLRNLVRLSRYV